jgi:hypothetical protein
MPSITQANALYIGFVIAAFVVAYRFTRYYVLPRSTCTSIYGFLFVILFWSTLGIDAILATGLQMVELWIWAEADPRLHQAVANSAPIAVALGVLSSTFWFLKERRRIPIDDETDYVGQTFMRAFLLAFAVLGYIQYEGHAPKALQAFDTAFLSN